MEDFVSFDEAALHRKPLTVVSRENRGPHWSERFGDIGRYDWFNKTWLTQNVGLFAFFPTILSQGYFGIFSPDAYEQVTKYPDGQPKKSHVKIARDEQGNVLSAYAVRRGRGDEPISVRMHRELLGCLDTSDEGDHGNGWGLDNRSHSESGVNLTIVSHSINILNTVRVREVSPELPRGVHFRRKDEQGNPLYGWMRAVRTGGMVKDEESGAWKRAPARIFRSPEVWSDPRVAHEMYMREIERLANGRKQWAHAPTTVNFPLFPPRLKRARSLDLEDLVQTILKLNQEARELAEIPF